MGHVHQLGPKIAVKCSKKDVRCPWVRWYVSTSVPFMWMDSTCSWRKSLTKSTAAKHSTATSPQQISEALPGGASDQELWLQSQWKTPAPESSDVDTALAKV
mmetsp:Transcript_11647/g.13659  ORF Transcript_11647/g.13659 Transcript_11647/m.13659 type:complete len:102 (+) Transcript_11647:221-526(+)